jgi:CheY-like chemotaxis protein
MGACDLLLADDDPADAELVLSAIRSGAGKWEVSVVRDGYHALEHLRACCGAGSSAKPAAVLLDLKMPGLSGFEVLRRIKSDARLRCLPVVIFTSSAETRDIERCYRAGANGYVVKPLEFEEFKASIEGIVRFWCAINIRNRMPCAGGVA